MDEEQEEKDDKEYDEEKVDDSDDNDEKRFMSSLSSSQSELPIPFPSLPVPYKLSTYKTNEGQVREQDQWVLDICITRLMQEF